MKRILFCLGLLSTMPAFGAVTLLDKDDWKIDLSGFVETDVTNDDVQGFDEVMGNKAVPRATGGHGRTFMSIRNSRLAFNVQAPTYENWKSRGYLEMDFLGFDPSVGTSGNTEAGFYNNPTFRLRHGYLSAENSGWTILTGQTWAMFGWQPNYFMPTIQVSPVAGMLYSRTAQLRGTKNIELSDTSVLQVALGIMRPPQRESSTPALEGGLRWYSNAWTGAFTGGATGGHKPQPLSVAVSGTVRQFEAANDPASPGMGTSTQVGSAVAFDTLIPILPSSDGKSSANNLVLGGEFTIGSGDGDQFNGWTAGQSNPVSSGSGNAANLKTDAGIGGYMGTEYGLFKVQTWNAYLQYHLPENLHSWMSVGYGQLFSANAANFIGANSALTAAGAYYQDEVYFANLSHDFTDHIRAGVEYAHVTTNYVDGTKTQDNRTQISTWFLF